MAAMMLCGALAGGAVVAHAGPAEAQNAATEAAAHPRVATAINALLDARAYLMAAPHDFGGHRAAAVQAIDAALAELRVALRFRAAVDRRR